MADKPSKTPRTDALAAKLHDLNVGGAAATPPKWIPITERWPIDSDYEPTGRIAAMNSAGYATCVTGLTLNTICDNRCDGWDETPEESTVPITDVVRWMPLPEPPK